MVPVGLHALRQQSQSLLFRLTEPHTGLAVGAPVSVIVQRRGGDTGLVLPEAAVVLEMSFGRNPRDRVREEP